MTVSTDIQGQRNGGTAAMLAAYTGDFAQVIPITGVDAPMFVRLAQGLLRRDRDLAKAAQANPGSFFGALLDCARLGHQPGTGAYHLVVFGREIQGIEDYKGKVDRIYRAGAVGNIKAEVVYRNDHFAFNPARDSRPSHEIDWTAEDRGPLVLAYAFAEMRDGSTSRVIVMTKAQIDRHRAESRGATSPRSPWNKWYESMALKTVVHELEKWVPSSAEYRAEMARSRSALDVITTSASMPGVTPDTAREASDENDAYEVVRTPPPVGVDPQAGEVADDPTFVKAEPVYEGEEEEPW